LQNKKGIFNIIFTIIETRDFSASLTCYFCYSYAYVSLLESVIGSNNSYFKTETCVLQCSLQTQRLCVCHVTQLTQV